MADRFAVNSNAAPPATGSDAVPTPKPATQSGGTKAMPIAVPAAADVVSDAGRTVVYAAVSAQKTATSRSSAVGAVRAAISRVISWNGSASVSSAAPPTTTSTLSATRSAARSTRNDDPTANPIPSSIIGPMSGDTSIAPMTTAVLSSTRPTVAMPIARINWIQYPGARRRLFSNIAITVSLRADSSTPSAEAVRCCTARMIERKWPETWSELSGSRGFMDCGTSGISRQGSVVIKPPRRGWPVYGPGATVQHRASDWPAVVARMRTNMVRFRVDTISDQTAREITAWLQRTARSGGK